MQLPIGQLRESAIDRSVIALYNQKFGPYKQKLMIYKQNYAIYKQKSPIYKYNSAIYKRLFAFYGCFTEEMLDSQVKHLTPE